MKFPSFAASKQLLLVQLSIIIQVASHSNSLEIGDENSGSNEEIDSSQRQGSWSHWWSYDGISGPDYWNINKRWRLCSAGRKQSPIDIPTDRLVYDHLLGPLQFAWLPAQASALNEAQRFEEKFEQKPIKVQLLNSGRGIEVWLERSSSTFTSATATSATNTNTKSSDSIGLKTPPSLSPISQSSTEIDDQLILAKGPLSYAYKLYKIELHSSSSSLINFNQVIGAAAVPSEQSSSSSKSTKTETNPESLNLDEEEEEGKESSANLATAKTSEHLVGGHAFDGELQLHFYNKHSASSASEALRFASEGEGARPNLFAAVSVFIQTVTSKEETSVSLKSPLDFILDNLSAIPNESNTIELQLTRKHLQSLVTTSSEYLTYQGSMNRPPCVESVDWILLNRALRVDSSKFDGLFEKLNTNQENIRPVRPLNRRLLRTTISNLQVKIQGTLRKSDSPRDDAKSATRFQLCQSNEQNCSLSQGLDSMAAEGGNLKLATKDLNRASCIMRPNYSYKLTSLGYKVA